MSQTTRMGGFPGSSSRATSNRIAPIALLGLFVLIGVATLHALDDSPTASEKSLIANEAATQAAETPVQEITPTVPPVRNPSEVKVLVVNGTQVSGVAAKFNDAIRPFGYQVGTPGNSTSPATESSIQYASGFEQEAKAFASSLNLAEDMVKPMSNPAPITDTQNANVLLVIGEQLAKNPPTAPASSTQSGAGVIGPLQSSTSGDSGTSSSGSAGNAGSGQGSSSPGSAREAAGQSGSAAGISYSGQSYSGNYATTIGSTVTTTPVR